MALTKFYDHFDQLCRSLDSHGAFLVVKDKDGRVNTMTIGWATIGIVWSRPLMTVLVRPVRFTHELIENAVSFSVCVPGDKTFDKALMCCGTKSGKKVDKAKECGLTFVPGKLENTVVVKGCNLFYECEIVHKNQIDSATLNKDIIADLYPKKDFHTIYFGEIKYSYTK